MPHQCLKCGSLFGEGTTTILRGCPDCHGTRFFYTKEALTMSERERMLAQTDRDMPALVQRVLAADPREPPGPPPPHRDPGDDRLPVPDAFEPTRGEGRLLPDGRLLVRLPHAIHKRVRQATAGWDYEAPKAEAPARAPPPAPDERVVEIPKHPAGAGPDLLTAPPIVVDPESKAPPETVRIPTSGEYEIDVQRLLEKSPIVIQKDGSYLIHLPSLFDMPRKDG